MPSADLAIIGAGPYGLSLAAHARRAGLATTVLGPPMGSWAHGMPAGMHLETEGWGSNLVDPDGALTLAAFAAERGPSCGYRDFGRPVPLDTFRAYGSWFQQRAGLEVDPRRAAALTTAGGTHAVTLDDGDEVTARTVAVALGMTGFPLVPPPLSSLGAPAVLHASGLADPRAFAGRRVAVVGGGQSALELSALLAEAGATVTLLIRGPGIRWHEPGVEVRPLGARVRAPRSPLGDGWVGVVFSDYAGALRRLPDRLRLRLSTTFFPPAGAWWLRPRVERAVEVRAGVAVRRATLGPGGVELGLGGSGRDPTLEVDHVVAATGYRPDVQAVPFLAGAGPFDLVAGTRSPRLSAGFESSRPGICFTGALAGASFGPGQLFLAGIPAASRRVTATAARRAGAPASRRAERCQWEQSARCWPAPVAAARAGAVVARRLVWRRRTPGGLGAPSRFDVGDRVRVKAHAAIASSLDDRGTTRGLRYMESQWAFCGRTFAVDRVARQMLDDHGVLRPISRAVVLAGPTCDAGGSGCGRACALLWKDEWLEPAAAGDRAEGWEASGADRGSAGGAWATIRPLAELRAAAGGQGGMALPLDADRYAGGRYRVDRQVEMSDRLAGGLPAPPVGDWFILEGVRCDGRELACPHPCDRRCGLLWHRSWLELEPEASGRRP